MKNTFRLISIGLLLVAASFAQYQFLGPPVSNPLVGSTTLSTAVTTTAVTQFCLASATGVVLPSLAGANLGSVLFVDREAAQVTGPGATSTCFRVTRGRIGSIAQPHASGAPVWIGNPTTSSGDTSRPGALNLFALEDASPAPLNGPQPVFGGAASSSAVPVAGSLYISEITVEHSRPVTGICVLNGSVVGTDNHIFALYDYAGNLLGQTAATLAAGATQYQCQALVTPIEISGLRSFFIAVQSNGTTATIQKYVTGQVGSSMQAGSQTGTSGTIPTSITPPSTFTTATGPIAALY